MADKLEKEKVRIEKKLMEELNVQQSLTDEALFEKIEQEVLDRGRHIYLSVSEKQQLKRELFHTFRGLDVLSGLLEDVKLH